MAHQRYGDVRLRPQAFHVVSETYTARLQIPAEGHALFRPKHFERGGGAVGDVGVIDQGSWRKLFHMKEPPPSVSRGLWSDESIEHEAQRVPDGIIKSSSSSQLHVHVSGSSSAADLSPADITFSVSLKEDSFAYLATMGVTRVVDRLKIRTLWRIADWLSTYHADSPFANESILLIDKAVRVAGWSAGVAFRESRGLLASFRFLHAEAGASAGNTVTTDPVKSVGPPEFDNSDPTYTAIIQYIGVKTQRARRWGAYLKVRAEKGSREEPQHSAQHVGPPTHRRQHHTPDHAASGRSTQSTAYVQGNDNSIRPDRSLLDGLFDHVLDSDQNIDVIVASSKIIHQYMMRYAEVPVPHRTQFELECRVTKDKARIAHLRRIYPQASLRLSVARVKHTIQQLRDCSSILPTNEISRIHILLDDKASCTMIQEIQGLYKILTSSLEHCISTSFNSWRAALVPMLDLYLRAFELFNFRLHQTALIQSFITYITQYDSELANRLASLVAMRPTLRSLSPAGEGSSGIPSFPTVILSAKGLKASVLPSALFLFFASAASSGTMVSRRELSTTPDHSGYTILVADAAAGDVSYRIHWRGDPASITCPYRGAVLISSGRAHTVDSENYNLNVDDSNLSSKPVILQKQRGDALILRLLTAACINTPVCNKTNARVYESSGNDSVRLLFRCFSHDANCAVDEHRSDNESIPDHAMPTRQTHV